MRLLQTSLLGQVSGLMWKLFSALTVQANTSEKPCWLSRGFLVPTAFNLGRATDCGSTRAALAQSLQPVERAPAAAGGSKGVCKVFAQAQPPLGVPRCKEEREESGLQGESERASSVPYTVT